MDYEKKYKEALEWARNVKQGKVGFVLDDVLEKFPELKESDSDMMRNGIIEELIHLIDGIVVISNQTIERKHKLYKYIDWLKSLEDRVQPQPQQEWSEDDEANLDYLIDFCNGYYNGNKPVLTESTARSLSNWLYQLKSCEIMPKTNKIDNEEAEKTIHLVCEFIRHRMGSNGNIGGIDYEELIKRLKSLRPQNTWKPSNEHYELEEFAKIVRGNLTGISKDVQKLFEHKYLQLTGNKMYGGYKD